ncbi:VanW family protein [Peptoniphilus gorbachii]|uniref:Vancomycin resistance protein YoaR n=1 Tax=Peptoniphilus gorbachii TaxID=411567 RepID=A0ABS2MM44_9FIRM|nr:VanW family protein [Peptoniphilus gorbachii]MBM7551089.1 vancomycin resistance protein YoaR [Peptoniphilus gorbachii]
MENLGNKILNINKKILITLALILMLLFISVMYFTEEYTNPYMHRGVRIEDIDVSNLSKEDALKEVKSVTDEMIKNKVVNFTYEDISVPVPLKDFGYKLNLEDAINKAYSYGRSDNLFYNYLDIIKGYIYKKNFVAKADIDDTKREEVILNIGSKIFKKALDAYPIINEDGSVTIKDSEIGRYMDINEAKNLINLDILHEDKIELPVYKTEPKIYSNYYDGIDKKLGDFETDYSSSIKNRKENIRLAASKFNNMKLNPGDEISFNDVVGEISEKTGFKSATVIVGGEYESGIGGGICQVSTTLYNSLILSDLEITERHNHSRPIHYVDLGTDAAVARGYKDLKFKNNTNNPILILSEANGEKLNFKVLGNGSDRDYEVKIIPQLLGTVSPGVDTIYSDALPDGESTVRESGARGYSYKTYKEIIKNGEVVDKKEISKSYYLPKDKVVVVGTGTTNDDDSENNDED